MQLRLRYIPHSEIDFEKWDACVSSHPAPQPYGFSWYLNWTSGNWNALVHGDYEIVFPIFPRKKWGVQFSTRPYGTQQLGPYSKLPMQSNWTKQCVNAAMEHVRYAEFFLSHHAPIPAEWTPIELPNLELATNKSYDELLAGYSSQTRRNLKKAQRAGLEFAQWVEPKDVRQLWTGHVQEKTAISQAQLEGLMKVLDFCYYQKRAEVIGLRDEYNALVASQVWVRYEGRLSLLMNAATAEAKALGAPTLLIDHIIEKYAGTPWVLDFEGSAINGLYRFYSGFGAINTPFHMHVENRLPWPLSMLKHKSTR